MILFTLLAAIVFVFVGDKLVGCCGDQDFKRNKTWNPSEHRHSEGQV